MSVYPRRRTNKMENVLNKIKEIIENEKDTEIAIKAIKDLLHKCSIHNSQPVDNVIWVPLEKVEANDYNPNMVAHKEMELLYRSIKADGYTQPVVTIYNKERDKYVIVDGFHRYSVCKEMKDIYEINHGMLPIVVIDKNINERMASTIRHNRARGVHAVNGMSSIVFSMLDNGWTDADICNELGLEPDELLKLKYLTGFAKLFENTEYRKAWETKKMIKYRMEANVNKKDKE